MRSFGSPVVRTTALLAGLATAVAWFWAIVLAPGDRQILANGDLLGYFYPLYETTYPRLASGEIPLWNPYQLCGIPWVATLQGGFLYPPHALYLVLATPTALATLAVGHLALAASATAWFARQAGMGFLGAGLAGLLVATRGQVPGLVVAPNFLEAASWLPVGAIGVLHVAGGRALHGTAVLACAFGMSLLAGYPQPTVYCLYAWATLLVALAIPRPSAWPRAAAALATALVLGALLAAVQILPAQELSSLALRQTSSLDVDQMYPFGGGPLITGYGIWRTFLRTALGGTLYSYGLAGVAALLLAPASPARALAWWAILFGASALLFALGDATGFLRLALALPGLSWFRIPHRILFVVDFCFAVAAAAGLDAIARAPAPALRRRLAVLLAAAVVLGVIASRQEHTAAAYAAPAVAAAALLGLAAPARLAPLAPLVVVATAATQAATAPPPGLLMPYDERRAGLFDAQQDGYRRLARIIGHDRFWLFYGTLPPHDLMLKQATRHRLRTIDDYEPLNTRRQAEYVSYLTLGQLEPPRPNALFLGSWPFPRNDGDTVPVRRPLLDLAAVRWIVVPRILHLSPSVRAFLAETELRRAFVAGEFQVYENPRAIPRAYVVHRTAPSPPAAELLPKLADPRFDPLAIAYVEGPAPFAPDPAAPPRGGPATFVRDDERVVEVEATATAPGLLVLADTFYPGWVATVDGAPAPIVATNHLFRGVAIPAGTHRVRFEYRPSSFTRGLVASAVAAALVVAMFVAGRRRGAAG